MFFATKDCSVYINTYAPEYLQDFEGNCYAQFSNGLFFSNLSAPCYYWSGVAEEAKRQVLQDESGESLTLSCNCWWEAMW